ncbi:hypothetical protein ABEY23_00310 [Bacillus rhizoplanae]
MRYSYDRKWISFLATPTASWSMDRLCIIGADGSKFEAVNQMLIQPKWFQWAPSKNILAYIEGEGRFTVENKHLKLKELPAFQQATFTPKGYVDWDFTWNSNTLITISRAMIRSNVRSLHYIKSMLRMHSSVKLQPRQKGTEIIIRTI